MKVFHLGLYSVLCSLVYLTIFGNVNTCYHESCRIQCTLLNTFICILQVCHELKFSFAPELFCFIVFCFCPAHLFYMFIPTNRFFISNDLPDYHNQLVLNKLNRTQLKLHKGSVKSSCLRPAGQFESGGAEMRVVLTYFGSLVFPFPSSWFTLECVKHTECFFSSYQFYLPLLCTSVIIPLPSRTFLRQILQSSLCVTAQTISILRTD